MVCAETPRAFGAVGFYYRNFAQTEDDEVRALLAAEGAGQRPAAGI
jgi:putative phosphoribosyl transferase